MIDRSELLTDLQKLLRLLEAISWHAVNLWKCRSGEWLRAEFDKAKAAERTAQNFTDWRSDYITQVCGCVGVEHRIRALS